MNGTQKSAHSPSYRALTRLFRADTPHDIACAAIVAETLPPGMDILVFSSDKAAGEPGLFAERMRTMACLHSWSDVIDISGLPLGPHFISATPPTSRLRRVRDTIASYRMLRRRLAPVFGLNPQERALARLLGSKVDELYLTCFHHPDVQAMYGLFPRARKIFTPHGFDSLSLTEIHYHSKYCANTNGGQETPRNAINDLIKRLVFGDDAVLPRRMVVDAAYSFNLPMPWARAQHDLRARLNPSAMGQLFSRLPEEVRRYYERLARQCQERTALLLLAPYDPDTEPQNERVTRAIVKLASRISEIEKVTSFLIKPHPRNSAAQLEAIMDRIAKILPRVTLIPIREQGEYPVEIVLAAFSIRTYGAFGSSSLRTLKKIYGTTGYCPEQDLLELFSNLPDAQNAIKLWVEDNRKDYIAV